jgi:hypothetical protein
MNKPSAEQQRVLDHVQQGKNVIVEACAGSGKSTTILSLAKAFPHLRILQFTYNKMLRLEIKEKVATLKLTNLDVHTFHSFAVKHYTDEAAVDTGIRKILLEQLMPRTAIPVYEVVVLDECQDMTPLFFNFVRRVLEDMVRDSSSKIQLVVLGDARQCLYEFKSADARFLTMAPELWRNNPVLASPEFERCTLRTSYRITRPMADFVNQVMLGSTTMTTMKSNRDGPQVVYMRRPKHQIEDIIIYRMMHLLRQGDSPSDMFVLAHSVKSSNRNIVRLANKLVEAGIPVHMPAFETDDMEDCVVENKVVFSTFHTAKGRERKHVFLPGFDMSYFSYAPDLDPTTCPNTLYVGCTRATQNLFVCEYDSSCPLEFLHMNHHQMKQSGFINFQGVPQTNFFPQDDFNQGGQAARAQEIVTRDVSPTKLTKFIRDETMDILSPLLERLFVVESEPDLAAPDLPRMIKTQQGLYEEVSDLNGLAIPAFFFDQLKPTVKPGETALRGLLAHKLTRWQQKNEHVFLQRAIQRLPPQCQTVADYLYLANVSVGAQEEVYFKVKQIGVDEYTWLTDEMMQSSLKVLERHFSSRELEVEHVLVDKSNDMEQERRRIDEALFPHFGHLLRFKFVARADVLTTTALWELKCVGKLTVEHLMQTAVYAWLLKVTRQEEKECKILNVRTGEVRRLEATSEELLEVVVLLLRNKFAKTTKLGDDAFLQSFAQ